MRRVALAGCSPLAEGERWDHTGYQGLDIARMVANDRGLEDAEHQLSLIP
jgi:hypothetical protein